MKNYFLLFLLFCIGGFVYFLYDSDYFYFKQLGPANKFVSIENNKFVLDNKPFYPVILNYIVSFQRDSNKVWPSPYIGYYNNGFKHFDRDAALAELAADMALIKKMGFNTVRITGAGENAVSDRNSGTLFVTTYRENYVDNLRFNKSSNYKKYFIAMDDLLQIVDKAGLKVILLTKYFISLPNIDNHFKKLTRRFNDYPVLMAYDFYNEPLYFDTLPRKKSEVYEITRRWKKLMKGNAPNQLITVGLAGIREVFEWDPNFLEVDFLSMHPYEYERDQVRNEVYWYHKIMKKPWIIGETSLPADNDSVSYVEQINFAAKTLNQTYNCGGIGYSWWQFKDVNWQDFHSSYMGMVSRTGTLVAPNGTKQEGTPKPLQDVFINFIPGRDSGSCICLDNYYNDPEFTDFKLTGSVIDDAGKPVEDAVIIAWNDDWRYSYHAFSKANGSFEIRGDFQFHHWSVSATMHDVSKNDVPLELKKIYPDNIPGVDLGAIKINKLAAPY